MDKPANKYEGDSRDDSLENYLHQDIVEIGPGHATIVVFLSPLEKDNFAVVDDSAGFVLSTGTEAEQEI